MTVIEVAIGPGGAPGMFKVEVVASPVGEASATVELDAESLLARRGLLQQAVLASSVSSRRVLPETEQPVREVGELLFAGLLGTGEVAGRYSAAAAVAAERGEGLRVVLRIDTPALAGLPWEAMYDQAAGAYVCRQDQLVRHVPVASPPAPLRVRPPLRILGVVSSPRGLPPLDVEKEQDQLARALARPAGQGLAEVHWAPTATWADLQDLLLDGEWHVLHFIGHGDFDPGRDEGVLALVREDGRADLVAAHRLTDLLRQARPMPRLVVLNSCSGAAAGIGDLFSGTAAALVRGGVSAVAAMQYEISDPAAVAFARGFYAAIARGRGVDDAVSSGRVAILGTGDRTLEWVTPVLYLRGHDTRLFTLPAPAEDTNRVLAAGLAQGGPAQASSSSLSRPLPRLTVSHGGGKLALDEWDDLEVFIRNATGVPLHDVTLKLDGPFRVDRASARIQLLRDGETGRAAISVHVPDRGRVPVSIRTTYRYRDERGQLSSGAQDDRLTVEVGTPAEAVPARDEKAPVTTILYLVAQPRNTDALGSYQEMREVERLLQLGRDRERYRLEHCVAARLRDISQALGDYWPQIVHFAGHGRDDGSLAVENDFGRASFVNPAGLANLLGGFAASVRCVIVNACHSLALAEAVSEQIDYVVGMRSEILDSASVQFSVGFYQGLFAGKTVPDAFRQGRDLFQAEPITNSEYKVPILLVRRGT